MHILEEMYVKGCPTKEISKLLNRTQNAIRQRAYNNNLRHSSQNGNWSKGGYYTTLINRIQDEPHCIVCGIKDFLTINHINHKWKRNDRDAQKEWRYWLSQSKEEILKHLNVTCMNCNKILFYNFFSRKIDSRRQRAIERIALAYNRGIECFYCGYKEDVRILEIDHMINDNYKRQVLYTHIINMPLDEIKKHYQILCANHNKWKSRLVGQ